MLRSKICISALALALWLVGCATPAPLPAPTAAVPSATTSPNGDLLKEDLLQLTRIPEATDTIEADPIYRIMAAEFAGQRNQLPLAVEQYQKLAGATNSAELAERATKIALFARDTPAALIAAERWVTLAPKNLEARQIAAAMQIRQGNAQAAIANLEYVLAHETKASGNKLKMIASLLGREEDQATALEVMQELLRKRQHDPDALLVYAVLALRADKLDASRDAMSELVNKADINPNLALAYVAALQKKNMVPEAIRFLESALKRTPKEFGLGLLYARLLAEQNRYEDARHQFALLRQQAPDSTDVVFALGLLNLQTNRIDDAVKDFSELGKFAERRDDANYYLGQVEETRKHSALALERYRAVKAGPSLVQAQLRTAAILADQKKIRDAREVLGHIKPENSEQRRQVVLVEADILANQHDYPAAMAVFDKALNGNYDTALLYSRAMLAERMDRLDVLEADLREILKREPNNGDALNALGFTLADRTARYQEAHELISRALGISPDNFYVLDSMGWVLYRLGRAEEAITYLQKARAKRNDPEVAAHLGEVLWTLGRKDDARKVWDGALETHPDDKKIRDVIKRLGA